MGSAVRMQRLPNVIDLQPALNNAPAVCSALAVPLHSTRACACMESHDCASLWPLRDVPLRVDAGDDWGSERCGGPMPSSASFSGLSLGLGAESACSSGAAAPLAAGAAGRIGGCWYADPAARQASSAQVPHASARARSSAAHMQMVRTQSSYVGATRLFVNAED